MRAILAFFVLSSFLLISCSSNRGVSKAFSEYAHQEGVTAITVPGWLMKMAASLGDFEANERELLRGTDKIKILVIESQSLNQNANFHDEFLPTIKRDHNFEELIKVRDQGEDISVLSKMKDECIKEMIILVSGDENALIYLKGNYSPKMVKEIIRENSGDLYKKI